MPSADATGRPSWLREPCPDWCTREHHEEDHPEDRIHQDDGTLVPGIVAFGVDADLHPIPQSAEVLVRRFQVIGETLTWVFIGESERVSNGITLALQTFQAIVALLL